MVFSGPVLLLSIWQTTRFNPHLAPFLFLNLLSILLGGFPFFRKSPRPLPRLFSLGLSLPVLFWPYVESSPASPFNITGCPKLMVLSLHSFFTLPDWFSLCACPSLVYEPRRNFPCGRTPLPFSPPRYLNAQTWLGPFPSRDVFTPAFFQRVDLSYPNSNLFSAAPLFLFFGPASRLPFPRPDDPPPPSALRDFCTPELSSTFHNSRRLCEFRSPFYCLWGSRRCLGLLRPFPHPSRCGGVQPQFLLLPNRGNHPRLPLFCVIKRRDSPPPPSIQSSFFPINALALLLSLLFSASFATRPLAHVSFGWSFLSPPLSAECSFVPRRDAFFSYPSSSSFYFR